MTNSAKKPTKFATATVKANGVNRTSRTVEGWASVEEVDRGGDLMLASAFEKWLPRFKTNPVLCWCHNIFAPPIGSVIEIEIVPGKGLKFIAKFARTKFADEILQLFSDRALRAFSVQFIPHGVRPPSEEESKAHSGVKQTIEEAELLEISPVPVPAVANALAGKAKALDLNAWERESLGLGQKDGDTPPNPDPDADPPPVPDKGKKNVRPQVEAILELAGQITQAAQEALDAMPEGDPDPDPDADPDAPPEGDPEGGEDEPTQEEEEALSNAIDTLALSSKTLQDRNGSSAGNGA